MVAVALYFLVSKLSADNLIGFLSALFFVVHPIHTEAVTYIAGRADLLAAIFLLFAFLSFIKIAHTSSSGRPPSPRLRRAVRRSFSEGGRYLYWLAASFLYIIALLSKENALIFLFLISFYGLCFIPKKEIRPWIPVYIGFLLISATYVIIRLKCLGFPETASLSLIAQAPGVIRTLTIPKIWATYLGLLIFPISLHMERHFLFISVAEPYFWLGLVSLFLTVWLLKLTFRHFRRAFFYSGWFVITLVPLLNIVPLNATCAEHWLYLPAIGFWALVVSFSLKFYRQAAKKIKKIAFDDNSKRFSKWYRIYSFLYHKKIIVVLACLFFLFYCTRTIMRNFQWRNPIRLYAHDLRYSPDSFLLHNNLGVELVRRGKMDEAGKEFQAAVAISPRYATSHNNLGVVLENQGRIEEAVAHYQAAIDLNNYILAYGNLGRAYLKLEQPEKAAAILEKGKQLYPQISP